MTNRQELEEIKRMFYQAALQTEKARVKLDKLKALAIKLGVKE